MSDQSLTVGRLLELHGQALELQVISGDKHLDNEITTGEVHRPGLALAGFFKLFTFERVQLLGNTEVQFLKGLTKRDRLARLRRMFRFQIPCVIITSEFKVPREVFEAAGKSVVPLLRTKIPTSQFAGRLVDCLEREFAPSLVMHGELLDVFGMGLLIVGKSGIGKSEVALEMIERGHRLVADDIIQLRRLARNLIVGRSSDSLRYHMEVRGLGIIDVVRLFGTGAVCLEKSVELVVRLDRWSPDVEYERLGIEDRMTTILDVDVPEYLIPVEPGRNVAVLLEVTARHQRLRNTGINPAKQFNQMLIDSMNKGKQEKP
ncbi:HPr(Ser) kinase/phosphatase [Candidatus Sumerlaeota bacterium]